MILSNNQTQVMHGAFYNLLGQILARMDKEGEPLQKYLFNPWSQ